MKKLLLCVLFALGLGGPAAASEGGIPLDRFPYEKMSDVAALQNGARLFVNYCLNCHSATTACATSTSAKSRSRRTCCSPPSASAR
jgi:mono/diheme cytochrome c family protein